MNEKELREKVEFFFEKKVTVHIEVRNGSFYNGLILEFSDSLIIIHDRVLGETPIGFSEIKEIEKFRGGDNEQKSFIR